MGIYIKKLEIPDNCRQCFFFTERELMCKVTENFVLVENMIKKRPHNCPLVEVKTPHGRLIDEKDLRARVLKWLPLDPCGKEEMEHSIEENICVSMMMEIEESETVIESED